MKSRGGYRLNQRERKRTVLLFPFVPSDGNGNEVDAVNIGILDILRERLHNPDAEIFQLVPCWGTIGTVLFVPFSFTRSYPDPCSTARNPFQVRGSAAFLRHHPDDPGH